MPFSLKPAAPVLIWMLFAFGGNGMHAQPFAVSDDISSTASTDSVDRVVREHLTQKPTPGLSLAVIRDGDVLVRPAYGVANLAQMRPTTNATTYQLASVTKIVTGIGIMLLVKDDRLALDAPIHTYLPDVPDAWTGVTVRQAISHTSGLPNLLDPSGDPVGGGSTETAWTRIQQKPLVSPPGQVWSYNQTTRKSFAESPKP